jgi:CRISPR-associated endonuclease/helicase Cas3
MNEVVSRFSLFVFDEFHLFDVPQTASAMIAILLALQLGEVKRPPRFLLLSATSQDSQLQRLARLVGIPIETIKGDYQQGLANTPDGWRRILQPATLHLDTGSMDVWVASHFEDVIKPFFQRNRPGAKGVIICNSVATAYRTLTYLNTVCKQAGITLGINTGLTPRELRDLDKVDLLVATSTVDVGVDFRINLLIFESMNSASHIQRLGRLGRHREDSAGNTFPAFSAYGLLQPWVMEAVGQHIANGSEIERTHYYETIQRDDVYPHLQSFEAYTQQWAGVQSSHVLSQMSKTEVRTQYQTYRDALQPQFKALFPRGYPRYKSLIDNEQVAILDEARSFRGSSPFTALVQDVTDERRGIVTYNLITLLKNAGLEAVELRTLYSDLRRQGKNTAPFERTDPLAGYRLHSWEDKPRPIDIFVDRDLDATWFNCVVELTRVRLNAPGVPDMTALNAVLEQRTLVALLVLNHDPDSLRVRLRLGVQLELFRFRSRDGSEGCAVFGRDALLLDSILYRFRKSDDCRPLIF